MKTISSVSITLRKAGASMKFLSIEPLLGPIHRIELLGINWGMGGVRPGGHEQWMPHGSARFVTAALGLAYLFSSNSGGGPVQVADRSTP